MTFAHNSQSNFGYNTMCHILSLIYDHRGPDKSLNEHTQMTKHTLKIPTFPKHALADIWLCVYFGFVGFSMYSHV